MKYLFLLLVIACDPVAEPSEDGAEYLVFTDDDGACEDTATDFWYPDVAAQSLCEMWCCNGLNCRQENLLVVDGDLAAYCLACDGTELAEVRCITVTP